jgi:Tfp pilus tip-associated adhesin PilY1
VAIFGGGLDPLKADEQGNFLYIVDFETGETLYKRQVEGSVPGDPAAVDTDQDSFIDRVYFGTTAGFMYRLDLVDPSHPKDANARYPELALEQVTTITPRTFNAIRIEDDPRWQPVKIFDTANPGDSVRRGRPIYYPPTVQFVAATGRFALGFGTGERDSLGFKSDLTGRFYTFVDNFVPSGGALPAPLTESSLTQIDLASGEHTDLLAGGGGWVLVLDLEERLISAPAGLIGITFFATFDPQVVNDTCEVGPSCKDNPQCSLSGNSRIYLVESATADALLATVDGVSRFMEVTGFVTEPFTEQGLSKNQEGTGDPDDGPDADELTEREREMMEDFQSLMPANCKFGNHRIDIKLIAADTRLERIAAVPICIIEKNWLEVTE